MDFGLQIRFDPLARACTENRRSREYNSSGQSLRASGLLSSRASECGSDSPLWLAICAAMPLRYRRVKVSWYPLLSVLAVPTATLYARMRWRTMSRASAGVCFDRYHRPTSRWAWWVQRGFAAFALRTAGQKTRCPAQAAVRPDQFRGATSSGLRAAASGMPMMTSVRANTSICGGAGMGNKAHALVHAQRHFEPPKALQHQHSPPASRAKLMHARTKSRPTPRPRAFSTTTSLQNS